jgi:hypothetical protein
MHPVTPQEQESLARENQSTDRDIDRLIYELYGLTGDEIKIVEGDNILLVYTFSPPLHYGLKSAHTSYCAKILYNY